MLAVVKMDVTTYPEAVGLLRSTAQVPSAAHHGHEVHEPKRGGLRGSSHPMRFAPVGVKPGQRTFEHSFCGSGCTSAC